MQKSTILNFQKILFFFFFLITQDFSHVITVTGRLQSVCVHAHIPLLAKSTSWIKDISSHA